MTDQVQPNVNLEEFGKKSIDFYNQIKTKLETEAMSKYAALDYETQSYWLGETASEALSKAKEKYPEKIFYLVQVGSPAAFGIQSVRVSNLLGKKPAYDLSWLHR